MPGTATTVIPWLSKNLYACYLANRERIDADVAALLPLSDAQVADLTVLLADDLGVFFHRGDSKPLHGIHVLMQVVRGLGEQADMAQQPVKRVLHLPLRLLNRHSGDQRMHQDIPCRLNTRHDLDCLSVRRRGEQMTDTDLQCVCQRHELGRNKVTVTGLNRGHRLP